MVDEVTIRAELQDQVTQPSKRIRKSLDDTAKSAERLSGRRRQRDFTAVDRVLNGMGRTVGRLDRGMVNVSRSFTNFTTRQVRRLTLGLTALGGAVTFFGLRAANSFEQSQIAFEGLLGSQEKGIRLFQDLIEFNKKTPFELSHLTGAARTLLGFQFEGDQLLPLVKSTADIAAGLGAGAAGLDRIILNLGQVRAQGRVTGRELRDFATVGFPGYELVAQILGVSREEVRGLGEDAQASADDFIEAVMRMDGPLARFTGMAERQQKSLFGLWSNVKDIFTVGLSNALGPFIDDLKPLLDLETGALPQFLSRMLTTVGPPAARLLTILTELGIAAMPILEPVLTALVTGVGTLVEMGLPGLEAMVPIAEELGVAFGDFVDAIAPHMPELTDAFLAIVGVLPAFIRLLGGMVPLVTPIANLVTNLLGLDGVTNVLAGLLVVLLGYRALSGVVGAVWAMASALYGLAGAQTAAAAAGAGAGAAGIGPVVTGGRRAGGLPRALGLASLGVTGAAGIAGGFDPRGGRSFGEDLSLIGGTAATGALIGTLIPIPGVGTGLGALGGAAAGALYVGTQRLLNAAFGSPDQRRAMPTAPQAVQTNYNMAMSEGSIQVFDPQTELDIQRAVADGIEDFFNERDRRN